MNRMNQDRQSGPNSKPQPAKIQFAKSHQAYRVFVANEQTSLAIDESRIQAAVRTVLASSDCTSANISIAVVDDSMMHALNNQYLKHDYSTDVLSFVLDDSEGALDGEVIVSADTAIREAAEAGWSAENELLLYVIHGSLHLIGHDDHEPSDQAEMYAAEASCLKQLGLELPEDRSRWELAAKEAQS
jgi:probable rRNA maturation factor